MEQTLVTIKPGAVRRGQIGRVISRFEDKGLKIVAARMLTLTKEIADKLYAEHLKKDFYPHLLKYITSGPLIVMILECENVISMARRMAGPTDAAEAPPGSIRGDFSVSFRDNVVHASDCINSAAREIAIFKDIL